MSAIAPVPTRGAAIPWAVLAPGVLLIGALLLLFRGTAAAMVDIWLRTQPGTVIVIRP